VPGHSQRPGGDHESRAAGGHDKHAGHSVAMFRDKFWLTLALTIAVVVLSPDIEGVVRLFAANLPRRGVRRGDSGHDHLFYGGLVFIRGAQDELADRRPGMMTLISLAIVVAFVTSWAGTLGLFEVEIWWELATLITIMLLGHWLEMRSIEQAQGALSALAALLPDTAERVTGAGGTEGVPIAELRVGPARRSRPGGRRGCGRHRRCRRVADHRRVASRDEGARRAGHRRHGRRWRLAPGQGHRDRRPDRAVRDHAPGRAGAGLGVTSPGPG
jgi:P-type Cu2+ transporter